MAKNNMFPTRVGGGLLGKVVWLAVGIAVLMLIIHNPTEAAGWAAGMFHFLGQAVDGFAAFLRSLFG